VKGTRSHGISPKSRRVRIAIIVVAIWALFFTVYSLASAGSHGMRAAILAGVITLFIAVVFAVATAVWARIEKR
jgi:uncharacterized BrkB/YihY/UPF0761 family membrane protein